MVEVLGRVGMAVGLVMLLAEYLRASAASGRGRPRAWLGWWGVVQLCAVALLFAGAY